MKLQPDNYSCGIYSIINALLIYDDEKSHEEIKKLCGATSKYGTSNDGILSALRELGYKPREYYTKDKNNAWKWALNNSINYPLILLVDKEEHWTVIAGRIRNKVILIDSSEVSQVDALDKNKLLEKWYSKEGYYGIRL